MVYFEGRGGQGKSKPRRFTSRLFSRWFCISGADVLADAASVTDANLMFADLAARPSTSLMHILSIQGHKFHVVYGLDRITLWFDRANLPATLKAELAPHCRRIKARVREMKNNPLWTLKLRVFQPSLTFFKVLMGAIGGVRVLVSYVEIAMDIKPDDPDDLPRLEAAFLACLTISRLHRRRARCVDGTFYFNRAHDNGRKSRDVPVVYADKPSKLPVDDRANKRKLGRAEPKCLHVEWRRHGSAPIAELGISSIGDLMAFDFAKFFAQRMPLFRLPRSQTELGRILPGKRGVNADSLRKRAREFIAGSTLKSRNIFVLHDALREAPPKFASKLEPMTLEEWFEHALDPRARWN